MKSLKEFYANELSQFNQTYLQITKKLKRLGWYRFISFIATLVLPFILGLNFWYSWVLAFLFFATFLYLVKRNIKLEKQKRKHEVLKTICQNELLALEHRFSHFDTGKEFVNPNHSFSYDLDLFGEGSLFQYLNRTTTQSGKTKLAQWINHPPLQKDIIEQRQNAVKELASKNKWRIDFMAQGLLFNETQKLSNEIKSWAKNKPTLKNTLYFKWLIVVIPILTVLAAIPYFLGGSTFFVSFMIFVQWIFLFFNWKKISHFYQFFGKKSEVLSKYVALLNLIESEDFKTEYLSEIKNKVVKTKSAGQLFSQLKSLVKEFEYRQNILVGFVLNSIFLWDLRCAYKLWKWQTENSEKLSSWLDALAETDALISLANFANNHPGFSYPEIKNGDYIFDVTGLGHPLLHPEKRVDNNLQVNGWAKVLIITGANMAGKSTFLRTVGVNQVLARIGAPVCAEKMTFTPLKLYTNMRTTDSLYKEESYFFAELKRLKGVIEQLENGERIFVILDEMLKGTNSADKLKGSIKIIEKLSQLNAVSLIATHDLKLGELENQYPKSVSNKCFEIKIENNEMVFDYKLTNGVTQTMNATFLMKKMGII